MPLPRTLNRRSQGPTTVGLYHIPFEFVVPASLSTSACSHSGADAIRNEHLCPPPSTASWDKYDCSSKIARVNYSIQSQVQLHDNERTVLDISEQVNILPAAYERPPLEINEKDTLYSMASLRSARLQFRTRSWLTASVSQPRAVMIGPDRCPQSPNFAQVRLTFGSSSNRLSPPGSMKAKLRLVAMTYASNREVHVFPNMNSAGGDLQYTTYKHNITLAPHTTDKIQWERCNNRQGVAADPDVIEPSTSSTMNQRGPQSEATVSNSHSSHLHIPIEFHLDKTVFVPTFHSCFISRVYVLELTLSFPDQKFGPSINLRAPLQIGVSSDGTSQRAPSDLVEDDSPPGYETFCPNNVQRERDTRLERETLSMYALGQ
ncbi:hypothetical protein AB5N19_12103 [Seiridium cardinale]|uniref:Uncharacterized protein n=1 Tax=Seiridium cardinale TaxID=138064 RepID=A0ABR2XQY9_9PEZI